MPGIAEANAADLKGGDAETNAAAIRDILGGAKNAFRDIVALTAGAALVVADKCDTIKDGAAAAFEAMDSGAAKSALDTLVDVSNSE